MSTDPRVGLDELLAQPVYRSADRAGQEWIEATFCMKCDAGAPTTKGQKAWTFREPCPGTPVVQASFHSVGGELLARMLLQAPVSDAFRIALRFNPISFLSQHNSKLRKFLEPFTLITPVEFRIRDHSVRSVRGS